MDIDLKGKSVLITGASKGIGLVIAEYMAAEGCNLHLAARGDKEMKELAEALADYVKTQGRARYGVFAAHPLTSSTGVAGLNRPADTLFGFAQYDINAVLQLFIEGGVVSGPNFDSTSLAGGLNWWF